MREIKARASICWDCARTDCDWIKYEKPVKGWKAKKSKRNSKNRYGCEVTQVIKCPLYEKIKKTDGRKLAEQIWCQMDNLYEKTGELFDLLEIGVKEYEQIAKDIGIEDMEDYFGISVKTSITEGFELTKLDKQQ